MLLICRALESLNAPKNLSQHIGGPWLMSIPFGGKKIALSLWASLFISRCGKDTWGWGDSDSSLVELGVNNAASSSVPSSLGIVDASLPLTTIQLRLADGIRKVLRFKTRHTVGGIRAIFMHADVVDKWLMALGFSGAIMSGIATPMVLFITSNMMNNLGTGPSLSPRFIDQVNKNSLYLVYLSLGVFVTSFLEGFCWTRTGDRQAMRMRTRYLKAILRQDVEYFDLNATSMSEVITSVSSDSLIIQDVIGEKVPNFINNMALFASSYLVGFLMMWRLALVAFPTFLLLVIPGIMYARMFMDLARKIRDEYEKSGDVEFRSVEFAYPSRPENIILRAFDLKVPAGKTVALVGGSGSGKSTVIALMERFYDPLGGEIFLDGVDIRSVKLKWLRSQIGLVSQEPALFATSIKENLLFGKEEATMEEVVAAATASNAHNFISQLPQGYDTQVGESGVQMSGGQKQRIAIARAVLKSPRILLLDEATSALDSESERVVQEALDLASLGRTTIVVAHRLSTIRNADVIAVVQAGRVAELGSHYDLIRDEDGLYSSLVRFQQTAGAAGSDAPSSSSSALVAFPQPGSSESHRLSSCSRSSSTSSSRHQEVQEESEADAPPPVPSLRRLLLLNLPEWRQAALGTLGAMAFGAVQPLYAFLMGSMLSVYFMNDHNEIRSNTRKYSIVFLAMSIFSFLVNILQHYNFGAMGEHLTRRVRQRMLTQILTFEVGWFDRDENSTGAICSRLANDANVVRMLVGDRMSLIIQAVSAATIACTLGLAIAWKLALILIAIQPLMIASFYYRMVIIRSMSKKAIESQSESSKVAAE
uniref:Uncharacterized protein n=1 Tax=Musa acuminata subsp. malaccensis TaxID=214687 RepID=A0A804IBC5_MUSAM